MRLDLINSIQDLVRIEGFLFATIQIVSPRKVIIIWSGKATLHFVGLDQIRIVSDEKKCGALALALGYGIGGKGGGDRRHHDRRRVFDPDLAHNLFNADGQIALGGQALMVLSMLTNQNLNSISYGALSIELLVTLTTWS